LKLIFGNVNKRPLRKLFLPFPAILPEPTRLKGGDWIDLRKDNKRKRWAILPTRISKGWPTPTLYGSDFHIRASKFNLQRKVKEKKNA
jgi:hypothetical protein